MTGGFDYVPVSAREQIGIEERRATDRAAMIAADYAAALLIIVSQPWIGRRCPVCFEVIAEGRHVAGCPWLRAARALGAL